MVYNIEAVRENPKTQQTKYAGMAELADALDSGSSRSDSVEVQVLLPAPKIDRFRPVDFLSIAKAMVYYRRKAYIITRSVYLISRKLYILSQ